MKLCGGLDTVQIWVAGYVDKTTQIGGYCAHLRLAGTKYCKTESSASPYTNKNRLELRAIVAGLRKLKKPVDLVIYTTSNYIADGINSKLELWYSRKWKKLHKSEYIEHKDLWEIIYTFYCKYNMRAVKINTLLNDANSICKYCYNIAKSEVSTQVILHNKIKG